MMTKSPEMTHTQVLQAEMVLLRQEHRDLDMAIAALQDTLTVDMLTLKRLKRNKLSLKDKIARLEDAITPDIIA
jgi:hypothetical protein